MASEVTKRSMRRIGWLVILFVVVCLIVGLTEAYGVTSHKYKAGCVDKTAGWFVKEHPITIGTYEVHAGECWNTDGNITSHHLQVDIVRGKVAIVSNYALKHDDNELSSQGKWGFDYFTENHAQLCPGIPETSVCIPGFREQFDLQVEFFSPAWVRHLDTKAPGAKKVSIGPPFESPLGQKGYHLTFKRMTSDQL